MPAALDAAVSFSRSTSQKIDAALSVEQERIKRVAQATGRGTNAVNVGRTIEPRGEKCAGERTPAGGCGLGIDISEAEGNFSAPDP
jgi:hypothetical protein